MNQFPPSRPGYAFATADLQRAGIPTEVINRFLAQAQVDTQAGQPLDAMALLAQLVKSSQPRNANYNVRTYNFGTYYRQQILTGNPARSVLQIQNVGTGDIFVLFEDSDPQVTILSGSATGIATLSTQSKRSIQIIAGGNYTPFIPPSNAVTVFSLNATAQGIVIEGQ